MYRSKNRGQKREDGGVKGPSSALTQFLKDQGISAQAIKSRWEKRQKQEAESSVTPEESDVSKVKSEDADDAQLSPVDSESTETDDELPSTPFEKRMRSVGADSDEEEYEVDDSTVKRPRMTPKKAVKDEKKKTQILQSRRKKRKRAADLLDRRTDKIPTLQNLCIASISENIYKLQKDTDEDKSISFDHIRKVLGGISTDNLKNLAKALSKNRALNDHTLQLFLKTDLNELTFHDCSRLSSEGYRFLSIFSPHLTKLSLQMCGQLNNESLLYIAEKLTNLTSINLDGPFLINEETWDLFFQKMKGRLTEFHVSNTHRLNDQSLSSLLTNCGPDLVSLGLSRLDCVFNYSLLPHYLKNDEFHTLSIRNPFNEEDVSDEIVINIMSQVGSSLRHLNLSGCTELTDSMLIDGMAASLEKGGNLESLELEELTSITTDGLVYYCSKVSMPLLKRCSLRRCIQIEDAAVIELLSNSAKESLEYVNFNSLNKLTEETFAIMACPKLTHIDLSFVRATDDSILEKIISQNPSLKLMEVFGDNLITGDAKIPPTVTLTGRESDTL